MDAAELLALLTLRFTPNLGPRRIESLRTHFGSAQQALQANLLDLRGVPGLDAKSAAAVGDKKAAQQAETELQKCQQAGAQLIGRGLPTYPPALDALGDPPPVLWVLGDLPALPTVPRSIGLVGTRAASQPALSLTRAIAGDLARADVVVISGLARGIDTQAHTAAVEAGGVSIGVLGSAVDRIYPGENVPLSRRLTLISEYPLGTGPAQHHFPTRNRLIAALSAGVVIVEGEKKLGPLSILLGQALAKFRRLAQSLPAVPAEPPCCAGHPSAVAG